MTKDTILLALEDAARKIAKEASLDCSSKYEASRQVFKIWWKRYDEINDVINCDKCGAYVFKKDTIPHHIFDGNQVPPFDFVKREYVCYKHVLLSQYDPEYALP